MDQAGVGYYVIFRQQYFQGIERTWRLHWSKSHLHAFTSGSLGSKRDLKF